MHSLHRPSLRFALLCAFATFSLASAAQAPAGADKPATKMTKQQTEELFRSVDDIFAFASKDSHLEKKHNIKRSMESREAVTKLLDENFKKDKSAKRMERSELVLKKFGLLDRDFHLRPFLVSLLTEQIAGFYDSKTHTIHMLDWVGVDEQKPVLAHELTHALQDQHVPMEKWSNASKTDVSHSAKEDREHVAVDEESNARQAVTEGQAMVVYIDYVLKPQGITLAQTPQLGEKLRDFAETNANSSPVMSRAPLLLQKSMMFPYTDGLNFIYQVQKERGTDAAFAGTLDHPPATSHEILHPQDYLAGVTAPVLAMPDVHPLLDKDWEPYDVGTLGELDIRITAELFGGKEMGEALAPAWAGGIYYAAQRRAATAEEKQSPSSIGLLYYSQWKNEDSARSFMRMYAARLGRKYSGLKQVSPVSDQDHQIYTTTEGDVVLTLEDTGVFISEGFPRDTAKQLDELFRGVQGKGPTMTATMPVHEPALTLSTWMNSMGITRAAMQSVASATR